MRDGDRVPTVLPNWACPPAVTGCACKRYRYLIPLRSRTFERRWPAGPGERKPPPPAGLAVRSCVRSGIVPPAAGHLHLRQSYYTPRERRSAWSSSVIRAHRTSYRTCRGRRVGTCFSVAPRPGIQNEVRGFRTLHPGEPSPPPPALQGRALCSQLKLAHLAAHGARTPPWNAFAL